MLYSKFFYSLIKSCTMIKKKQKLKMIIKLMSSSSKCIILNPLAWTARKLQEALELINWQLLNHCLKTRREKKKRYKTGPGIIDEQRELPQPQKRLMRGKKSQTGRGARGGVGKVQFIEQDKLKSGRGRHGKVQNRYTQSTSWISREVSACLPGTNSRLSPTHVCRRCNQRAKERGWLKTPYPSSLYRVCSYPRVLRFRKRLLLVQITPGTYTHFRSSPPPPPPAPRHSFNPNKLCDSYSRECRRQSTNITSPST